MSQAIRTTTETRNSASVNLDSMSSLEIVTLMNDEDSGIASAVRTQLPKIAMAADLCIKALENGGRIVYDSEGAGREVAAGALLRSMPRNALRPSESLPIPWWVWWPAEDSLRSALSMTRKTVRSAAGRTWKGSACAVPTLS